MSTTPESAHTATVIAILSAAFWGLYWIPIRYLARLDLDGAPGTLALVLTAMVLLSPFPIRHRRRLSSARFPAVAAAVLAGVALGLFSVGLAYGRVAIVLLLFYLTPVWSALMGRVGFGWPITARRVLAIVAGLGGLSLMLGADGLLWPNELGEWLGVLAGVVWAAASTGIRTQRGLGPGETTFLSTVGALATTVAILMLVPGSWSGVPAPDSWLRIALAVFASAGLWWGAGATGLLWAATRLEPARLGILFMSEALVGVVSAVLLAGEHLRPLEALGGVLILAGALVEVWPGRAHSRQFRVPRRP